MYRYVLNTLFLYRDDRDGSRVPRADLQVTREGRYIFETKANSIGDAEVQELCSTALGDGSLLCKMAVLALLGEIFCIFFQVPARMH